MLLINAENLFLIIIGLIWIIGAVLQDLHRREVDNLWNFSLIGFALAYRASISVYTENYWFLINGLIGFGIFLFLGNVFYYSRAFAGGDAKLLIALGVILPFSYNWISNFEIFGLFIILFLIMGSFYVLLWSGVLVLENLKNFSREFLRQWKAYSRLFLLFLAIAVIFAGLMFFINIVLGILLGLVFVSFPFLFVFAKSVEESCMKKYVSPEKLGEGEWLYKDIVVDGTKIKADWEGVSKEEIKLLRTKYKKDVLIKEGIPFTPGFLLAFIALLILLWRFRMWF